MSIYPKIRMAIFWIVTTVVWTTCSIVTTFVFAQSAQMEKGKRPPAASAIDQQLLEDLGPLPATRSPSAKPKRPKNSAGGEDVGQPPESGSPLDSIGRRMRQVEPLLREKDTARRARQLQDDIAADLLQMIESQQENQGQSGTSNEKTAPKKSADQAGNSSSSPNPEGTGSPAKRQSSANREEINRWTKQMWGVLPDRVQQQVRSLGDEKFLPAFEEIIQQYYAKLSERSNKQP